MWRNKVLLPQPLPPMMTKISAAPDFGVDVAHDDKRTKGHGQIANLDFDMIFVGAHG